ncbi:carboxysome shell protein CsoS2 [Thiohalobacter thiocyanaticus]|uniref:Carboxysome shell protein CsoS2 n=1 Tax=Thiohalobacter thiocyanaticus TaxID=585455 RepID=A0A1Z4VNW2_9GAMM|nr:CsoS2 family carboxysome shell protein [Thiohalobacter thiocyanaticus]BAZ93112.1 carboxysome shell protein CsoS2 [Thiohalobacter thiocyanaticus]
MAQTANSSSNSAREASRARRRAMSQAGKAGLPQGGKPQGGALPKSAASGGGGSASTAPRANTSGAAAEGGARAASRARRQALSTQGKAALKGGDRTRSDSTAGATMPAGAAPEKKAEGSCGCGCKDKERQAQRTGAETTAGAAPARGDSARSRVRRKPGKAQTSNARAASLARRQALSSRGKAGLSSNGMTAAQTARAANPQLTTRELARAVREQRSRNGGAGHKKSEPCGRKRSSRTSETSKVGPAQDAPWKVGAGETSHGQTVTGTMVGRSRRTTGDEYSTCRNVTGTEYMGADIFRDFCQTDAPRSFTRVGVTSTARGGRVTGNRVGRGERVTGDEPGTCKRVTGTEYVSAEQSQAYCASLPESGPAKVTRAETSKGRAVTGSNVGRSSRVTGDETGADRELTGTQYMQRGNGKHPDKVGRTETLRGGGVTGTLVGRSERVTGDEPGTCKIITGDDYIGREQYQGFCGTAPAPQDQKVGVSQTLKGLGVSGSMTGRSGRVTGDEPGTCKAITGTPYAGAEQYRSYCAPEQAQEAEIRTRPLRSTPGMIMTGQQPGIDGKLTGAGKGACETVSGTPYVGADQYAAACPATPAEPGAPDFPQPLGADVPWGRFSVHQPSEVEQIAEHGGGVSGTRYETSRRITGPFGMAGGKVTGTEEARFGPARQQSETVAVPPAAAEVGGRVKPRISGEGMDAGVNITGDDWDRGDRVTGTEGMSATRRNPTQRSGRGSVMSPPESKRNEGLPEPVSRVTGGSGNTDKGSLVTYSGGARG